MSTGDQSECRYANKKQTQTDVCPFTRRSLLNHNVYAELEGE